MKGSILSLLWRVIHYQCFAPLAGFLLLVPSVQGQDSTAIHPEDALPNTTNLPSRRAQNVVAPATNSSPGFAKEPLIKAEFVLRFRTLFVWPNSSANSPANPWRIGVLGVNPYRAEFEQVVLAKKAEGVFFDVVSGMKPEQLKDCQIIFIPQADSQNWSAIHREWDGKPVLLVGEQADFIERGGMVWIRVENEKPFLEISRRAVDSVRLELTGQLYHRKQIKFR